MPPTGEWRRYAAPAAFLLAATIAVVLVRSGLESSDTAQRTTAAPVTTVKKRVATTTTTTKRTTTAAASGKRFWTVRAGDTFGVISSETGVPVATIERLNPDVSSTSLFIGQKIRIE